MRSVLLSAALLVLAACASVPVDPRDELALQDEREQCGRGLATLKVVNNSTYDVRITLRLGSGGERVLRQAAPGFGRVTRYQVDRTYFNNGYAYLRIARGGVNSGRADPVWLEPIRCNVGTLKIAPAINMSIFFGADL